jgi:hypothetical protein
MRTVMTYTKTCHRIVIIGGSAGENRKTEYRRPRPSQRTTGQRVVVIRNGVFVSRQPNAVVIRR